MRLAIWRDFCYYYTYATFNAPSVSQEDQSRDSLWVTVTVDKSLQFVFKIPVLAVTLRLPVMPLHFA